MNQWLLNLEQFIYQGGYMKIMIPTYFGFILLERIVYIHKGLDYNKNNFKENLKVSAIKALTEILVSVFIPFVAYQWVYENFRIFTFANNEIFTWVLVFILHDLFFYIDHILCHKVGIFWAFHSVHHSSKDFNISVGSRGFALIGTSLCKPLVLLMPLVGFSMFQFVVISILTDTWGILVHTRTIRKLGWLDYVFSTPSNHRVHHGIEPKYIDRNYGQVLMIWDQLFGTFQEEYEEPNYGLMHDTDETNPLKIQFSGLKWLRTQYLLADRKWDRFMYFIMPPGWKHDGTGQTAKQLKSEI
ncbi:MAG: sterol desaturase family protein [Leadbetterella sp.]